MQKLTVSKKRTGRGARHQTGQEQASQPRAAAKRARVPQKPTTPKPSAPDRDNPAWTDEEFARARPALGVFPAELAAALPRRRGQRGPQRQPAKQLVSLRIDGDVLARFRATGAGWQSRVNDALKHAARSLH